MMIKLSMPLEEEPDPFARTYYRVTLYDNRTETKEVICSTTDEIDKLLEDEYWSEYVAIKVVETTESFTL